MTGVLALTERQVRASYRNLDIVFAVLAPILTYVGFTIGLRSVIDTGGISYGQYILPAVVVQAMLFGALNTTDLAASERTSEFGVRLRTFPLSPYALMTARMLYCLIRGSLALLAAIAVAYPFGFRMDGGLLYGVAFVLLALVLTMALSFGADAVGARAKRSDTSSQLLLIPQLLVVLLSTGMAPVESFPRWVQPFVAYQPISQITETLRGFASGRVAVGNLTITVVWCIGLLLGLGYLALRAQRIDGNDVRRVVPRVGATLRRLSTDFLDHRDGARIHQEEGRGGEGRGGEPNHRDVLVHQSVLRTWQPRLAGPAEVETTSLTPRGDAFIAESAVFAGRLLTRWRRNPLVPLQSLLFPTVLLIVYYMLVSKSMTRLTGSDSLDVVVSMCALAGGMSGSLAAGLSIPNERDNGLLSRFWMMPVHRASALTGTLLAEASRTLVATIVITAVGMLLGLRFHGGVGAAALFVLIPVLWVSVYATVVVVIALRFQSRTVLTWFSTFSLGAVFGSAGVAPMNLFPAWIQPFVRFQPMSPTIEAMKALARDGFEVRPLLWTFAWIFGIGALLGTLAMRSYRAAAQSGS